ncbi:MAG: glutamate 5-kinase [Desulfobacteraceae bacterium]
MPYERLKNARRVVVKVGSNVVTAHNSLNTNAIQSITYQICMLIDRGLEVLLVSSGALAAGLRRLGLDRRPDEIPQRQAIAAVGQSGLIKAYEAAFGGWNALLTWKVVPIINENDTVMVEEIKLGDNDNLSAMIALLMDADFLINLTDIDGLYTKDPRRWPDAELIPEVSVFKKEIETFASSIPGALGTGGMLSKIRAAKKVTSAGVPMIIAKGDKPDILIRLMDGEKHGTYFVPKSERMASRKCWIAYTLKPKGRLILDDGAVQALIHHGKSLLPIGIVDVEGEFDVGAAVEFADTAQEKLGIGLVNYTASDIRAIKGLKTLQIKERLGFKPYDEVIHRDNLVVTPP